ncbi:MAG TPA: hypothetical protein PKM08_02710 [Syntrophorhabdaceae bacterium]|nr:hypothetical protein [Syntrophorhabdaceae bacterium]HNT67728.1 hypothetical protein [Syntrophorhabdaceae bacterium]
MASIDRTRLQKKALIVFLAVSCAAVFCFADAEAKNWSRYFGDETQSYYYDKDSITYPYKKKRVFGWVTDKETIGLWVKVTDLDKEPPDMDVEMFQPDENVVYVEVTCPKKEVNVKDNVPYDIQKGRMTSRIIIPDEKILRGIESRDAKEALVSAICR